MSALTYELKKPTSPVTRWLHATFPNHKDIQAEFRTAAGVAQVLPTKAVSTGTQGAAIDWWLRMLVDPSVSLHLAVAGLRTGRIVGTCAGVDLLATLTAGAADPRMRPADFGDRSDEWWARVSYALALLVELYRAASVEYSRLTALGPGSTAQDLLALANDDEVADLIAMRDLARERLLAALPAGGEITTGMTFEGSKDLNADGDLIANGMLVDFKAAQGNARKDGARTAALPRTEIDQLLGYTLMDYSDAYRLHTVAVYAVRFGHLAAWPLDTLCTQLAGRPVDLPTLRHDFKHVLRTELPATLVR